MFKIPTKQECRKAKIEGAKRRMSINNQTTNFQQINYPLLKQEYSPTIQRDLTTRLSI